MNLISYCCTVTASKFVLIIIIIINLYLDTFWSIYTDNKKNQGNDRKQTNKQTKNPILVTMFLCAADKDPNLNASRGEYGSAGSWVDLWLDASAAAVWVGGWVGEWVGSR